MFKNLHQPAALVAAALTTLSFAAGATQTIKLTAVSGYAPTAVWVNVFQTHFIPEVDRRLAAKGNYRIEWNQAWGTVAKPRGELDALQNGLGDIGIVQTVFHPDKLPMFNIGYVTPFITTAWMPMSEPSPTVQPCSMTMCPTVTSSPTRNGKP